MYMSFSPPVQIFFASILCGLFLGVFWDIILIIKKFFGGLNNKIVFIFDIIFWAIAGISTLIFFLIFTSGGFRGFVVLGEFLGFLFYYILISCLIFDILKFIVYFILTIFTKIFVFYKNIIIKIGDFAVFVSKKLSFLYKKNIFIFKKINFIFKRKKR